jgi:MFS-type transporter involved in bile tolerance (Atg22 family)
VFVFTETGSGTSTATLFVVELIVAVVLGPVGGSLVDRWDLRRTLVATNVVQALALLPLLAVTPERVWPAFVVAGVQSALTQLNNPAKVALLPRLVSPDQLMIANAASRRVAACPVSSAHRSAASRSRSGGSKQWW